MNISDMTATELTIESTQIKVRLIPSNVVKGLLHLEFP
jgi:hypothetical protein